MSKAATATLCASTGSAFAALAGGEHTGAGGQLRRHVEDGFAVSDQALGDVPADAAAAFDRPHAVLVFTAGGEHRLVAVTISAEATLADGLLTVFMISMVADRLWGSTDDDSCHFVLLLDRRNVGGRAALLELESHMLRLADSPPAKLPGAGTLSTGGHGMVIKSEEEVKKVLGIDTWRNLSKDKVFRLVAMMPEMDKQVQLRIIEQLPEITKLAVKALTAVRKVHESTLLSNEKSQENVHLGYQEARAAFIAQLQRDDLDPEERRYLSEHLMQTADKESAKDSENKHYLDRWVNKAALGVGAAIILTAVAAGGKVALQNGDALRKL